MGMCDLLGLRCDLEKYSKTKKVFFFFFKEWANAGGKEKGEQNIKIFKVSGWGRGKDDASSLQVPRDKVKGSTMQTSTKCSLLIISPALDNSLDPLFSVSAAGVQHPRSSHWASLTSQVRKFLLMPSHGQHCLQTIKLPTFCRWWATSVPSDILVSSEWLCWWRLRLRYLDV